jgi:nucleotidyltransferase/DNA polymerase involved in DNA repair
MTGRVGYLHLPHLSVQISRLRHPTLSGRPVIISGDAHGTGRVVDASTDCLLAGIRPGMVVREALELVPGAECLAHVVDRDADIVRRVLDLLERFSEIVEANGTSGGWFLPAKPMDERRLAAAIVDSLAASLSLDASVGLASGRFVARLAAERAMSESVEVVGPGQECAYLAPLPVTLLPLQPKAIERLELLGLLTIDAFAHLPADSVPRRFGREALRAHEIARGIDSVTLVPRQRSETLAASRAFEPSIHDRGIVLRTGLESLQQLCRQLVQRRQVFRSLRLDITLENGRQSNQQAELRHPTNDVARCRPVLERMVEALTLADAVASIAIRLSAIGGEEPVQTVLFDNTQPIRTPSERRARVVDALTEASRRYRGRLRRIVRSNEPTHLLDDRRLLLLPYELDDGLNGGALSLGSVESAIRSRPIHVLVRGTRIYVRDADGTPDQDDEIVALYARWEADDWWPQASRRTYYRVRSRSGVIATIARDHDQQRWFLVTTFD